MILLVTGYPGWLTEALRLSLAVDPLPGLQEVRWLVQPGAEIKLPSMPIRTTVCHADLGDRAALASAVRGCGVVLHAAGILHVRKTSEWYRVNTEGTDNLVRVSVDAGVRRFVLISSNAAAGCSSDGRQLMTEDDEPRPLSHYGRSKQLAERVVLRASLEGVVLRPCMFYGPPVPRRHVDVYRRILTGRMPLIGGGGHARSVTHIDNLVQACQLAITHPKADGQVYYIADRDVYTTRTIIEAMARALGVDARFLHLPGVCASLAHRLDGILAGLGIYWQHLHLVGEGNWHVGVSIAKAERELGYDPKVSLQDGMNLAVQWCRDRKLL